MLFSARAGAFLLALAGPALLPAAAAPPPAFRTDDPRYARLYALEDKADALFRFLYRACGLDKPNSGMIFMEKVLRSAGTVPPPAPPGG